MAPGSRTSLVNVQPMPIIVEDDGSPPPDLPEKSYRRSNLSRASYPAYGPPPYTSGTDGSFPDRQAGVYRAGLRDKEWFARRGGWYRVGLIFFCAVVLVVGLAVGLTIGIRHSTPESQPPAANLFPAGSYSFTTALTSVSTACTSNPETFRCYPYATYNASSPDASSATFTWIITALGGGQYTISSAPNPFAPQFSDVTLMMLDGDQETERLTFNITMSEAVVPATPIVAGQDATATCWFNSTALTATLWTRQRAIYPANITNVPNPASASDVFAPWPYAVEIREVQAAGPGVPDCVDLGGRPIGNFEAQNADNADVCGCWYSNFELGNATDTGTSTRRRENG